ncbi:hypothetical protein NDA11_007929 [Ustilago hordei]|uniref:Uncharacterized protein n=1 Tax=Ustilago hordei TaxID=120017 RepID=I2G1Q2_USTHO|nr:uncharacterized protein UHO2_02434 [Ustilago hordei]KAJ1040100.1 hypothetical protein NDA10_000676 [Ustilago hordei]KAJ1585588.1 hypothetical protein NDA15_007655 [Ustilago hordei]KAJ1588111.1 hypothetical protein NDA12_003932 [Ustilago hordei]KAJ1593369.1 hypothetical protein NDA11_007929 [Ustilago hordei]KAJ1601907.1 hypothetical protein NDA14_007490 [Ustilago hordei]
MLDWSIRDQKTEIKRSAGATEISMNLVGACAAYSPGLTPRRYAEWYVNMATVMKAGATGQTVYGYDSPGTTQRMSVAIKRKYTHVL